MINLEVITEGSRNSFSCSFLNTLMVEDVIDNNSTMSCMPSFFLVRIIQL